MALPKRPARTPFSPSMRRHCTDPKHDARAVGVCFEECAELPEMLVQVVVGDRSRMGAMIAYRQVNKQFAALVDTALNRWCKDYAEIKDRFLEQWCQQNRENYWSVSRELDLKFIGAFGSDPFILKKGRCLSKYTPDVCMDILRQRCSMCKKPLCTIYRGSDEPAAMSFSFSHLNCEMHREYCHVIDNAELIGAPNYPENKMINFSPHNASDKLRAVMWHWKPFADEHALSTATSPLTQYINGVAYGNLTKRVEFHDVVKTKLRRWTYATEGCNLVEAREGMLHSSCVQEREVKRAIDAATDKRNNLRWNAEERKARARAEERDAISGRAGQMRVQLVMAKLPWHTPAALTAYSPHMLEAIGFDDFVQRNEGTPNRVMRTAAFVADSLHGASKTTIDFFLAKRYDGAAMNLIPQPLSHWTFRGSAWRHKVTSVRKIVNMVETYDAARFTLKVKTARKHLTDFFLEDREIRNLATSTPALLHGARAGCKFIVASRWEGTSETDSVTHTTIPDSLLYELRAACGLEKQVNLSAAIDGLEQSGMAAAEEMERCATKIVDAALKTEERTNVLSLLDVPDVVCNILDNGWGVGDLEWDQGSGPVAVGQLHAE
mgnify:CR=1 FL=1